MSEQCVSKSIKNVIDYLAESELEGQLDPEDPWWTVYMHLNELLEKVLDEEDA